MSTFVYSNLTQSNLHAVLAYTYSDWWSLQAKAAGFDVPDVPRLSAHYQSVFWYLNPFQAYALQIGLWLGAIGWDILSTLSFDLRLARQTNWRSFPSSVHSVGYYLSRYATLAWLIITICNLVIPTRDCMPKTRAAGFFFALSISSMHLIFMMRTISIWNLNHRVILPLLILWLIILAGSLTLGFASATEHIPGSFFCTGSNNKAFQVSELFVLVALCLFDLLCLFLTVAKLNKLGVRGIINGFIPRQKAHYDAEDWAQMLVHRTTVFCFVQFALLAMFAILNAIPSLAAFRSMQVIASATIGASMAGRIFRQSWTLTREHSPAMVNRPPSYYPGWAEDHSLEAGSSRRGGGGGPGGAAILGGGGAEDDISAAASLNGSALAGHGEGNGSSGAAPIPLIAKMPSLHHQQTLRNKSAHSATGDAKEPYVEGEFKFKHVRPSTATTATASSAGGGLANGAQHLLSPLGVGVMMAQDAASGVHTSGARSGGGAGSSGADGPPVAAGPTLIAGVGGLESIVLNAGHALASIGAAAARFRVSKDSMKATAAAGSAHAASSSPPLPLPPMGGVLAAAEMDEMTPAERYAAEYSGKKRRRLMHIGSGLSAALGAAAAAAQDVHGDDSPRATASGGADDGISVIEARSVPLSLDERRKMYGSGGSHQQQSDDAAASGSLIDIEDEMAAAARRRHTGAATGSVGGAGGFVGIVDEIQLIDSGGIVPHPSGADMVEVHSLLTSTGTADHRNLFGGYSLASGALAGSRWSVTPGAPAPPALSGPPPPPTATLSSSFPPPNGESASSMALTHSQLYHHVQQHLQRLTRPTSSHDIGGRTAGFHGFSSGAGTVAAGSGAGANSIDAASLLRIDLGRRRTFPTLWAEANAATAAAQLAAVDAGKGALDADVELGLVGPSAPGAANSNNGAAGTSLAAARSFDKSSLTPPSTAATSRPSTGAQSKPFGGSDSRLGTPNNRHSVLISSCDNAWAGSGAGVGALPALTPRQIEKRRSFLASPPLSAGPIPSQRSQRVYDFKALKEASEMERPRTAATVSSSDAGSFVAPAASSSRTPLSGSLAPPRSLYPPPSSTASASVSSGGRARNRIVAAATAAAADAAAAAAAASGTRGSGSGSSSAGTGSSGSGKKKMPRPNTAPTATTLKVPRQMRTKTSHHPSLASASGLLAAYGPEMPIQTILSSGHSEESSGSAPSSASASIHTGESSAGNADPQHRRAQPATQQDELDAQSAFRQVVDQDADARTTMASSLSHASRPSQDLTEICLDLSSSCSDPSTTPTSFTGQLGTLPMDDADSVFAFSVDMNLSDAAHAAAPHAHAAPAAPGTSAGASLGPTRPHSSRPDTAATDDGRPRTSRGGPVHAFGATEIPGSAGALALALGAQADVVAPLLSAMGASAATASVQRRERSASLLVSSTGAVSHAPVSTSARTFGYAASSSTSGAARPGSAAGWSGLREFGSFGTNGGAGSGGGGRPRTAGRS
ncbi:hypothetical protein OC835_004337 [Tilletia horrida]|nr:hypothetical protein OC835_004337 [Tilletia horrida]